MNLTNNRAQTSKPSTEGRPTSGRPVTRRRFLRETSAWGAGMMLASRVSTFGKPRELPRTKLPKPKNSGIEHIVVVMMENRSFDHFLGWLPGANGKQAGLTYVDATGVTHSTYPLAPDYQGCGHPGPDHSYEGGRVEYNNGACDGWLRAGSNDIFSIGYYEQKDLAFLGQAAPAWTTCDSYFAAIMAETFPNRIYQHAAQTDRLDNALLPLSTLPTIWDRLAERGISSSYYFSDFPFLALWGVKYLPISQTINQFYTDCAAGTLPQVSFVDPRFVGEAEGLSNDDHPFADIRNGEAFLNSVYEAVISSPNWRNTVLVINYDEWGGFFEHVAPSTAPIPPADAALGDDGLRGFRVPALVISPWAARRSVAKGLYDHTSVLKMIEWRYDLEPLTVRDATANNLIEVLDFTRPNVMAPRFSVPEGPFGTTCAVTGAVTEDQQALLDYAAGLGFPH